MLAAPVERAHALSETVRKPAQSTLARALAEEERVQLEILLAELQQLKSRLRIARANCA